MIEGRLKGNDVPNLSDVNSYANYDFYNEDKTKFITISDFITTHENHEQSMFNVETTHSIFDTPLQIEKNILEVALWTVGDDKESKYGSVHDLVVLSSCTHYMEKYKSRDANKIIEFTERQRGKWYFQPNQRCEVVQSFIDEDPRIAIAVKPFKEVE